MLILLKKVLWALFLVLLLLGVPRLAGLFAHQFDYTGVDPHGAFAWVSVHHIFQAVVFLIIMVAVSRFTAIKFGFGWGDRKVGLFYVRLFAMIFFAYTVVSLIIIIATGSFQEFPYPLIARNIVGQLGFQLLLSGPSEELIFRAFSITMLALLFKGRIIKGKISIANIIAALIFGLAHVGIAFAPFALSYNVFQVVYSVALGLVYGVCYEQSKSMIYPMIMHSMSNVVAVGVSVIAGFLIN